MEQSPINPDINHTMETSIDGATISLESEENLDLNTKKCTLVGKVLTEKILNKNAIKNIILKAWSCQESVLIQDLGANKFLFNFKDVHSYDKALKGSPWSVMGHLLSLKEWVP